MNPVQWFEIPVNDIDRAKAFYENTFGIEISAMDMFGTTMGFFPFEENGVGATGALVKAEGYTPSHEGSVVYFSVESIEDTLAKAEANNGSTIVPKMSIGEHGFIAHFQDTEGNRVALHSNS